MTRSEDMMRNICNDPNLTNLGEEFKEYEESLKKSEQELINLLGLKDINMLSECITLEQLSKLTFNRAHDVINKMSISKRIKILNDLDYRLVHLYVATKEYNDEGFGKSMSPKDFIFIMGRIKYLEILQQWLYGIE